MPSHHFWTLNNILILMKENVAQYTIFEEDVQFFTSSAVIPQFHQTSTGDRL